MSDYRVPLWRDPLILLLKHTRPAATPGATSGSGDGQGPNPPPEEVGHPDHQAD